MHDTHCQIDQSRNWTISRGVWLGVGSCQTGNWLRSGNWHLLGLEDTALKSYEAMIKTGKVSVWLCLSVDETAFHVNYHHLSSSQADKEYFKNLVLTDSRNRILKDKLVYFYESLLVKSHVDSNNFCLMHELTHKPSL